MYEFWVIFQEAHLSQKANENKLLQIAPTNKGSLKNILKVSLQK